MLEGPQKNKIICKCGKSKAYVKKVKELQKTIKILENSLIESQHCDRQILMSLRMDTLQTKNLQEQLQEALKENDEFVNILQLRNGDSHLKRPSSKVDINSSCSTMSLVNLQYKYEELLSNHHGLLKVLDLKNAELKKYAENQIKLQQQIEEIGVEFETNKQELTTFQTRYIETKRKKDEKISKLKQERHALGVIHNRLVALLHRKCIEKSENLGFFLRNTPECNKALLLQEAQRNNILSYENFQLQQELEYLRSMLNLKCTSSRETIRSTNS